MKIRPLSRSFVDEIYGVVYVALSCKQEDVPRLYQRELGKVRKLKARDRAAAVKSLLDSPPVGECAGFFAHHVGKGETADIGLIYVQPGMPISVLVHEVWHACFWCFQEHHVDFSGYGANEPMAYYLDWMIDKILLTKRRKK